MVATEGLGRPARSARTPAELEWWLAQLSWAGDVEWSWTLRFLPRALHPDVDTLRTSSIAPASGGGYLLAGDLRFREPTIAWVKKVDAEGHLVWHRTFEAAGGPNGAVVLPLRDGGAYLAGRAGEESRSFWAARLAGDGEVVCSGPSCAAPLTLPLWAGASAW